MRIQSLDLKADGGAGPGKVKGNEAGEVVKKDQELVLYEFIGLLVRIAFQRANPTFGNFGNKRPIVMLPGCLERMLEEEVLPRARRRGAAFSYRARSAGPT